MRINGLEKAERDPNVYSENVEVAAKHRVDDRPEDSASTKDEDFSRVRVFSR